MRFQQKSIEFSRLLLFLRRPGLYEQIEELQPAARKKDAIPSHKRQGDREETILQSPKRSARERGEVRRAEGESADTGDGGVLRDDLEGAGGDLNPGRDSVRRG